jgi:hypothetical protein
MRRESLIPSFFVWLIYYTMMAEFQYSKISQAEKKWGLDLVAEVFMNINNMGRGKAFRKYEAEENYEALECIIFLTKKSI